MIDTALYRSHLETLDRYLAEAIERSGKKGVPLEGVLFHAGRLRYRHADDEAFPFVATPHFRRWVPLSGPEHVVLARPGQKPLVVEIRPQDFWYDTSAPPPSYWEEAVELAELADFDDLVKVTGPLDRIAYIGDSAEAAAELGIPEGLIEPEGLMLSLDWNRAYKTDYEVALLDKACRRAAAGHLAAREVFQGGASELEIYWAYLEGSGQTEAETPFNVITALDEKAAILHYQNRRGADDAPGKVLLLDAGASWSGYASDITRTWTISETDPLFSEMVREMDRIEQDLVAMVTPGRPYPDIHLEAHRRVAGLLVSSGLGKGSAEELLDQGITRAFLPHGVGHHLGIQVHDVGGHMASPDGERQPPPEDHPFLRTTRTLEPGQVLTIEPGIYFIPMLLDPLRAGDQAHLVDWDLVDRLTPCGGIRIEDDVLCTEGEPVDMTRPFLPGP